MSALEPAGRTERSRAGTSRRAGHARRIRRLRMPVLRQRVSRSSRRCRQRLGNELRFVFRNFPLTEAHPHASTRPPSSPKPPQRRASSGRCTTRCTSIRPRSDDGTWIATRRSSGSIVDGARGRARRRRAAPARARRFHERRSQRRERHAHVLHQRPAFRWRLAGRGRISAGAARARLAARFQARSAALTASDNFPSPYEASRTRPLRKNPGVARTPLARPLC